MVRLVYLKEANEPVRVAVVLEFLDQPLNQVWKLGRVGELVQLIAKLVVQSHIEVLTAESCQHRLAQHFFLRTAQLIQVQDPPQLFRPTRPGAATSLNIRSTGIPWLDPGQ